MHITLAAGWNHSSIHREGKAPTDGGYNFSRDNSHICSFSHAVRLCSYKGVSRPRALHHVGLIELVDMAASKAAAEMGSCPNIRGRQ